MRSFRDLSIRQKLVRVTLAGTLTALCFATSAFIVYELVNSRGRMVRKLATAAAIVGYNGTSAIVFSDPEAAAKTLQALHAEPHVVWASIYTADEKLFASYQRSPNDPLRAPAELRPPHGTSYRFEQGSLLVFQPISFEDRRIGTVVIESDLGEVEETVERYLIIAAIVSLCSLLVALLVSSRYLGGISHPILELAAAAGQVSRDRNYAIRVESRGHDEIGQLVHTFNDMLTQIQKREAELRAIALENEQLYREARDANRLKDEFLATFSHELRTPLNAIAGWTQLLKRGQLDPAGNQRAIETIDRNAQAQIHLVEDILDVSRIVTGKLKLKVAPLDLRAVAQSALESLRPAAEAKEIDLRLVAPSDLPELSADFDRLQQVVWNLVSNAIKFTTRGGSVEVKVRRVRSQLEVQVSDTGSGIAPEFLPHVFERFRQADASTTRAHGGLGLGLAIVRHLVELHGGTVAVSSPGLGRGATFTVLFPLRAALPAQEAVASVPSGPGETAVRRSKILLGLRVLIVDDDEDSRQLLLAFLARAGLVGIPASSGPEALELLRSSRPDLLISDIGMPGMDGYAFLREVRSLPADQGGSIRAAALTAYARPQDRAAALAAGFQEYMAKPFDFAELERVLISLIGHETPSP